ncbi:hypothetical protein O181_023218 [Austropuccinia psidii MF-1]|uniref:Secreted protein n=1 Tax=Austropuccinia psidii MF-1 TaxID=1389203 RepID=A0A9Q3GX34_9BASI|nr:hypothetical protein [Austropuccinia psidii MF-1]
MFVKAFGFQLFLLALAFALTSAQRKPPAISSQLCTDGLHPDEEAEKLICDTISNNAYSCTTKSCHIHVNNKYLDCTAVSPNLPPLPVLHPSDFKISNDRQVYNVKSGWYFKNQKTKEKATFLGQYKCPTKSVANKVHPHESTRASTNDVKEHRFAYGKTEPVFSKKSFCTLVLTR